MRRVPRHDHDDLNQRHAGRRGERQVQLLPPRLQGGRRQPRREVRHPAAEHGVQPQEARGAEHQLPAVPRRRAGARARDARPDAPHARLLRLPPASGRRGARRGEGRLRDVPREGRSARKAAASRRRSRAARCSRRAGSTTRSTRRTSCSATSTSPRTTRSSARTATRRTSAPACHDGRVRPRNIHPNDYLNMHAVEGRLATQKCTSCHREQSFCLGCHQRVGVSMSGPVEGLGALPPAEERVERPAAPAGPPLVRGEPKPQRLRELPHRA